MPPQYLEWQGCTTWRCSITWFLLSSYTLDAFVNIPVNWEMWLLIWRLLFLQVQKRWIGFVANQNRRKYFLYFSFPGTWRIQHLNHCIWIRTVECLELELLFTLLILLGVTQKRGLSPKGLSFFNLLHFLLYFW